MLKIVHSGCQQQKTDAAADMSTDTLLATLPSWPTPSCKDWNNITTIATNIASLLNWLQHPPSTGVEDTTGNTNYSSRAANMDSPKPLLLQSLLQILDALLTGAFLWCTTLLACALLLP